MLENFFLDIMRGFIDGCKDAGNVVRSGLTHEYFIKKNSMIFIESDALSGNCGIHYDQKGDPQIVFYVQKYFNDFEHGFKTYYNQLKKDTLVYLSARLSGKTVKSLGYDRLTAM